MLMGASEAAGIERECTVHGAGCSSGRNTVLEEADVRQRFAMPHLGQDKAGCVLGHHPMPCREKMLG
ncbi:hypothetical protein FHS42_005027 [Streptomyces zagrosensis]|uniref:Uncharacterized protein n=1 Tax=Streptomyces zagrosensis TaxID=1042984 RepID=A0A7W9QCV8_9ACTN|nr:hypothetical protein [Streptomyces zagrosensis]